MNLSRSSLFGTVSLSALLVVLLWWYGKESGVASNTLYAQNIVPQRWAPLDEMFGFGRVAAGFVSLLCGFMIVQTASKNMFYFNKNLSSMVLFVLFSSLFLTDSGAVSPMVATALMVFSFGNVLRSYPLNHPAVRRLFHSSFYLGVAVFIYPPFIYFVPMLWVLLSLVRLPEVREWVVLSAVWMLPFGLYFMAEWLLGADVSAEWSLLWDGMTLNDGTIRALGEVEWLGIAGLFVLLSVAMYVLGVLTFIKYREKFRKRGKAAQSFFAIFTVWALAVMLLSPVRSLYLAPAVAVGLSVTVPIYLGSVRSLWVNLLYGLLLIVGIAVHSPL
ncbi:MAG: hypothetical protein R3Y49_02330 [Rikenellaceae bacterium]